MGCDEILFVAVLGHGCCRIGLKGQKDLLLLAQREGKDPGRRLHWLSFPPIFAGV